MTVISDTEQQARKRHKCDHCGEFIDIGDRYRRVRGVWEGEPGTFKSHTDCADAYSALHYNNGLFHDEGFDMRSDLEADDRIFLLVEFPSVAARLGIAP